ncbi:MAG: hypothetical protein Q8O56_00685 [Solirubrobacteraceae bacterium]|nr:hypothetical protein [Solirubrobacteraceae bacterium]
MRTGVPDYVGELEGSFAGSASVRQRYRDRDHPIDRLRATGIPPGTVPVLAHAP